MTGPGPADTGQSSANPVASPVGAPVASQVAIVMGSQSDWETMSEAAGILAELDIACDTRIVSAHRTPRRLVEFAEGARAAGIKVVIAGAGGAAHLPGMIASMTIVQMPGGIPVGTLAIGKAGAKNAGLLAAAILGAADPDVAARLDAWRQRQTDGVAERPA